MNRNILMAGAILGLVGCYQARPVGQNSATRSGDKAGAHDHGPGPHGGTLVEWGKHEYHPEFTVNHEKQEATVYILDGGAKKQVPITAKSIMLQLKDPVVTLELMAVPQQGDPAGTASRFVGKHEALGKEQEFEGTVSGKVDGTPYSGDFKEKPEEAEKKEK